MDVEAVMERSRQRDVIQMLLDEGSIEHPVAVAVAKIVLDKGEAPLKGKQRHIYDKFIAPLLATKPCCVCGDKLGHEHSFASISADGSICCLHHL
jgi:hypothetical protein